MESRWLEEFHFPIEQLLMLVPGSPGLSKTVKCVNVLLSGLCVCPDIPQLSLLFIFLVSEDPEGWGQRPGRSAGLCGVCPLPPGPREEVEAGLQESGQEE